MDYNTFRKKEILKELYRIRRFATANEIARRVDISWNTAKQDLDDLTKKRLVFAIKSGKNCKYRFKF
jgi:predicted ArsR family transcriptional regulator